MAPTPPLDDRDEKLSFPLLLGVVNWHLEGGRPGAAAQSGDSAAGLAGLFPSFQAIWRGERKREEGRHNMLSPVFSGVHVSLLYSQKVIAIFKMHSCDPDLSYGPFFPQYLSVLSRIPSLRQAEVPFKTQNCVKHIVLKMVVKFSVKLHFYH